MSELYKQACALIDMLTDTYRDLGDYLKTIPEEDDFRFSIINDLHNCVGEALREQYAYLSLDSDRISELNYLTLSYAECLSECLDADVDSQVIESVKRAYAAADEFHYKCDLLEMYPLDM